MDILTGILGEQATALLKTWGPACLFAAVVSLGIYSAFEYLFGGIFRLPGVARAYPAFQAMRPLLGFGAAWLLFHRLHLSGVVDFGPGPAGWEKAGLMAILGATGAHLLHLLIKRRWPWLLLNGRATAQGGGA